MNAQKSRVRKAAVPVVLVTMFFLLPFCRPGRAREILLKNACADQFYVGAALNPFHYSGRDTLLQRMRDHIHTIVGRYRGKIDCRDVVNEAVTDDHAMRNSLWYRIIGEDFVEKAFTYAREADPDAQLIYNDYSLPNPAFHAVIRSASKK